MQRSANSLLDAYNNVSGELQDAIKKEYHCEDDASCAKAMSPSFKEYTLVIGIIAFCMIGVSFIVLMVTLQIARPSRKAKPTETIDPKKRGMEMKQPV